jgi:hypothetical protein
MTELMLDKNQTRERCLEVLQRDGCQLLFVVDQDEGLCIAAVKQDPLSYIHARYRTRAVKAIVASTHP